jgi:hypothetical protein
MNAATWNETNGYGATRIYRENAVAAVCTVVRLQDGGCMAGLKGKSGPPGNMNAFKHGLAAIQKRREESVITQHEESVRQQILDGLIADKSGDQQISTATMIFSRLDALTQEHPRAASAHIKAVIRTVPPFGFTSLFVISLDGSSYWRVSGFSMPPR